MSRLNARIGGAIAACLRERLPRFTYQSKTTSTKDDSHEPLLFIPDCILTGGFYTRSSLPALCHREVGNDIFLFPQFLAHDQVPSAPVDMIRIQMPNCSYTEPRFRAIEAAAESDALPALE
ncbi:hypothetical protein IG631_14288 [Alternaria alternata]|nr:hypothetical protein IG631_14288 [Alternaria alternata]